MPFYNDPLHVDTTTYTTNQNITLNGTYTNAHTANDWIDQVTTYRNVWKMPEYVTEDKLEGILTRIRKMIEEYTHIDIPEEEFLKVLEDE